ncbi:hypothetical protein E2320_003789, partial [Naja naja]
GNVWEYLVKEVLNTTNVYLQGSKSVKDILAICHIGTATHLQAIQNFTKLRDFKLTRQRRELQLLTPDCDSKTALLRIAEYVALAVSLVSVPSLAVWNSRNISNLACILAKSLNLISQALGALNRELSQVWKAMLENRVAVDYLLLRHNHVVKSSPFGSCQSSSYRSPPLLLLPMLTHMLSKPEKLSPLPELKEERQVFLMIDKKYQLYCHKIVGLNNI